MKCIGWSLATDDDGNPDDVEERFTWQGVPYKHTVYVTYSKGADPRLKDISLNRRIASACRQGLRGRFLFGRRLRGSL